MLALSTLLAECRAQAKTIPAEQPSKATPAQGSRDTIEYQNKQYGFTVRLPVSWKGFTVVQEEWSGSNGSAVVAHGPLLLLRHPKWTKDNPRQDIPIMIFTLAQWKDVDDGDVAVSAAPIPPTELDHNGKYVFALPPRYNFALAEGWEEVQKIMDGKPLSAF